MAVLEAAQANSAQCDVLVSLGSKQHVFAGTCFTLAASEVFLQHSQRRDKPSIIDYIGSIGYKQRA